MKYYPDFWNVLNQLITNSWNIISERNKSDRVERLHLKQRSLYLANAGIYRVKFKQMKFPEVLNANMYCISLEMGSVLHNKIESLPNLVS